MRFRPIRIGRLFLRFLWLCALSGLSTARIILKRGSTSAGLVTMKYEPMSTKGVAVLGAMVTLTPGTSTVDINLKRRELLLHLLDTRTAEASIVAIQRNFEQDIRALFPEEQS